MSRLKQQQLISTFWDLKSHVDNQKKHSLVTYLQTSGNDVHRLDTSQRVRLFVKVMQTYLVKSSKQRLMQYFSEWQFKVRGAKAAHALQMRRAQEQS